MRSIRRVCQRCQATQHEFGVDAMAEELKAKAQVLSADDLAQECKALRPMAEMMWTAECA